MEDPAILDLNLDHFRRLLEIEADPARRLTIEGRIREIEAQLHRQRRAAASGAGIAKRSAPHRES